MKSITRKILSMALTLCMVLGLFAGMPMTVLAATATVNATTDWSSFGAQIYLGANETLTIEGTASLEAGGKEILITGSSATINADGRNYTNLRILVTGGSGFTINNLNLTASGTNPGPGIEISTNTEMNVLGSCSITGGADFPGILNIQRIKNNTGGTLTVNGGSAGRKGIDTADLTIENTGAITINGGTASIGSADAIKCNNLTYSGTGTMTATGGAGGCGIDVSALTQNGGTLTFISDITGTTSRSGIRSDGNITLNIASGAVLNAEGNNAPAIDVGGIATIENDGTINAKSNTMDGAGRKSGLEATGVVTYSGAGTLNATGGGTDRSLAGSGIEAAGLTQNGGTINALGGNAGIAAAIELSNPTLTVNSGTLNAEGGTGNAGIQLGNPPTSQKIVLGNATVVIKNGTASNKAHVFEQAVAGGTWSATNATITGAATDASVTYTIAAGATGTVSRGSAAPTISSLSPANGATDVAWDADMVLTFSKNVTEDPTKFVVLHKVPNSSNNLPAGGPLASITGNVLTINPDSDLLPGTTYYITIGDDVFKDADNQFFAGIADDTVWKFTTAEAVCKIGSTNYATLDAALAAVQNGQIIELLSDITDNDGLTINNGKNFTIKLAGFDLEVNDANFDNAVNVLNGSTVALDASGGGEFNAVSDEMDACAVYAFGGSKITVSNVTDSTDDHSATVQAVGAGSEITVLGDVSSAESGVWANSGGKVTVRGDVSSANTAGSVGVFAESGGMVVIDGDCEGYYGIEATGGSKVTVGGNVSGLTEYGVNAYDANTVVTVTGGVDSASDTAIYAGDGGKVTVYGAVSPGGGEPYVNVDAVDKAMGEDTQTTKPGFKEYTGGTSFIWVRNTAEWLISYNANGGSGAMAEGAVGSGGDYDIEPNAFTRAGYSFTGWNTQPGGGGTAYAAEATISNVAADITLYAQWTMSGTPVCKIGVVNYATLDEALAAVTAGQTITMLKNFTDTDGLTISNKTFTLDLNGFTLAVSNSGSDTLTLDGSDITVTANGGAFNVSGDKTVVNADGGVITITSVTATGDEWAIQAVDDSVITVTGNVTSSDAGIWCEIADVIVGGNVTAGVNGVGVSAEGMDTSVTVAGNVTGAGDGAYADDGAVVTISGNVTAAKKGVVAEGAGAKLTVSGYVHGGEYAATAFSGGEVTIDGVLTGGSVSYVRLGTFLAQTLKTNAEFTSPTTKPNYITYTDGTNSVWVKGVKVSFNANGGSGIMAGGASPNGSYIIPANAYTRAGYNFAGWNTQANGGGTFYAAGAAITGLTADTTLYAQWTPAGGGNPGGNGGSGGSIVTPAKPMIDQNGVKLDPAKIDTTNPSYTIDIKAEDIKNGSAYVSIPASILTDLSGKNAAFILEIKTPYGTYKVPVNLASLIPGLNDLLAKNNLKSEDITFKITLTDKSADAAVKSALATGLPNGKVLGAVVDFNVDVINTKTGAKLLAATAFTDRIARVIPMPKDLKAMPKLWGAFRYNEAGKAFEFVPATSRMIDGIWYVTISANTNSVYVVAENSVSFTDSQTHWGKDFIELAGAKGLVSGIGNGLYAPDKALTRAEFATMLVRALGLASVNPATAPYSDVKPTDWFYGTVSAAKAKGLLGFADGGSFKPNDPIRRDEMAYMIAQAFKVYGDKTALNAEQEAAALGKFSDADSILYEKEAALVISKGIIVGWDGRFMPDKTHTRAEAATVLIRTLQELGMIDR